MTEENKATLKWITNDSLNFYDRVVLGTAVARGIGGNISRQQQSISRIYMSSKTKYSRLTAETERKISKMSLDQQNEMSIREEAKGERENKMEQEENPGVQSGPI